MHGNLCCGGGGGGSGGSGGGDRGDWIQYCNLHCIIVVYSGGLFLKAMAHILNVCIATCVVVVVVMVHNDNGECTRAQSLTRPCPCATCNWLLHPAPTSAQDGLDPLQLALVVFFLPSISAKTPLACAVGIACNLHWCVFCTN